jgi:hypothetical protein
LGGAGLPAQRHPVHPGRPAAPLHPHRRQRALGHGPARHGGGRQRRGDRYPPRLGVRRPPTWSGRWTVGRLVLAAGKEDSASQAHRRGRRPCSAGSDECLPGFGARAVGLSSTISMTRTRPAGIGLCMSPGRMGICPSDGQGAHPSSGAAWLRARVSLRSVPRCSRVMATLTPGLERGASS